MIGCESNEVIWIANSIHLIVMDSLYVITIKAKHLKNLNLDMHN